MGVPPARGWWGAFAAAVSVQTLFLSVVAILAAIVLCRTHWGQMVYATGATSARARYAGIRRAGCAFPARRLRAVRRLAGVIYAAYLRSFNPSAGQLRELDGIASVSSAAARSSAARHHHRLARRRRRDHLDPLAAVAADSAAGGRLL